MKSPITRYSVLIFALILIFASFAYGQVTPFMSLGNAQFFDNNGKPLTAGVLYSFQAGTSTQQATYTDSTGLFLNPNPIPFGSGARVSIWLTSIATYKFVLCAQNDGASCAPADVLFSVDQVPGCPGCSSGGSTFTGTFISGTPSPATTGILRLASSDSICWRNAAGTANLCISKDPSDILSWSGGAIKLPEINCVVASAGFDYLCADVNLHRLTMFNNNGAKTQIVGAGVDVNNSDQVIQLHFGSTAAPISGTIPTAGQSLIWNGTNIVGSVPTIFVANASSTGTTLNTLTKLTGAPSTAVIATTTDTAGIVGITCAGAGTTGNASICQTGITACLFDGATTAGDYVQNSSTVNGNCHDAGATPGSGQVIGRVLSTNGGGGTYNIAQFPAEIKAVTSVTKDFSASGCAPTTSTDASCTGSITISPAFADAAYIPQLTINTVNGAFLAVSISGSLAAGSIPYTITCTFNCGSISTPTIYVHAFHP